jgi:alkane 1-monooxygenase
MGHQIVAVLLRFGIPVVLLPAIVAVIAWRELQPLYFVAILFLAMPAMSYFVIGDDTENRIYAGSALLNTPLWMGGIVYGALIAFVAIEASKSGISWGRALGLAAAVGTLMGGPGMAIGHELMHSRRPFERAMSVLMHSFVGYGYFIVEHVQGHHRNVCTPDDPATAKLGQSIYSFYRQSLPGELMHALRIEKLRLAREGKGSWSFHNMVIQYAAIHIFFTAFVFVNLGAKGLAFFLTQGLIAIILTQNQNYIAHYGITRRKVGPDQYERVSLRHSWDSYAKTLNLVTFNLGRHGDHHRAASKPYYALEANTESLRMPYPYPIMLILAHVPPIYFAITHPILFSRLEFEKG